MAAPTIAFVDPKAHPTAPQFYKIFPNEPIPGNDQAAVMVSKVVTFKESVEALLQQIVANASSGGNVLIVGHGTNAGLLLNIGDPRHRVFLETDFLSGIRQNLEGKAADDETARLLKIDKMAWGKLKGLIQKVQSLGLDRVDLRSCNIGKNDVTLSKLQVFFGCNTACAPSIYDGFGIINFGGFTSDSGVWQAWLKKHPGASMKGAGPPDRCAIMAQYTPHFQVDGLADSKEAVQSWVKAHLPPGSYSAGPVYFHAFTDLADQPVFAGDPGFRAKLVEAYKGKEPSRTIDVRKMQLVP